MGCEVTLVHGIWGQDGDQSFFCSDRKDQVGHKKGAAEANLVLALEVL